MNWLRLLGWALGYSAAAYVVDVPLRRASAARAASAYARARNKPLLNIGAGMNGVMLWSGDRDCKADGNSNCYPPTFYGDVNVDITGDRLAPHGRPGVVSYADAQRLGDFRTGQFGAVFASHVLEHLPDPAAALREWLRVVGGDEKALFVITPSWWAPHAWLPSGHLWLWTDGVGGLNGGKRIQLRRG